MVVLLASKSINEAGKRPIIRSVNELLVEYGLEPNSLAGVKHILEALEEYKIQLDPPFDGGGSLDTPRTLKASRKEDDLRAEIEEILAAGGEAYDIELKSSIAIDKNRMKHDPGRDLSDYKSPKLATKAAQEICAFLNRDGGIILFGVQNDNVICGCEEDLACFPGDGTGQDKADLIIKQIIDKHFVKSATALSFLQMEFVEVNDLPVILLRVAPSPRLLFLKKDCDSSTQLYTRLGTNAVPIEYEEIEEHFEVLRRN